MPQLTTHNTQAPQLGSRTRMPQLLIAQLTTEFVVCSDSATAQVAVCHRPFDVVDALLAKHFASPVGLF